MATSRALISVVSPVYEEEEVLPHFHRVLTGVLDGLAEEYDAEIILVDDGSRDGTLPLLRRLAHDDPRVHYHSFSRNFGHQAAITAGLERARGDVIVSAVLLGRVAALRRDKQLPALDPARKQDPAQSTLQGVRCFSWAASILGMRNCTARW